MARTASAYNGPVPAGPEVRQHEERIGRLERGLAVLEALVGRLVSSMDAEREASKESRQEDRAALRRLGEKMETSATILTEKMEKIARENASMDSTVQSEQSKARGAFVGAGWVLSALMGVASLAIAYQSAFGNKMPEQYRAPHESRLAR